MSWRASYDALRESGSHEPAPESHGGLSGRSVLRRRVLVVDDNVDAADMLADCLTRLGATVRAGYSERMALEIASAFAPDLVLLDLRMPDVSGATLARRLRDGCAATFFAVTGHRPDDVAEEIAAGAFDGCLTKPCSFEALRRVLLAP